MSQAADLAFEEQRRIRGERANARIAKRYAAERRFKLLAMLSVVVSAGVLVVLLIAMTSSGLAGFTRSEIDVTIDFPEMGLSIDPAVLEGENAENALRTAGLPDILQFAATRQYGPEIAAEVGGSASRDLAKKIVSDPDMLGETVTVSLPVSEDLAAAARGEGPEELRAVADRLQAEGQLGRKIDWGFLARADATDPQEVGIWGALKGSLLTMAVTLVLAFPIGVLAAVYLTTTPHHITVDPRVIRGRSTPHTPLEKNAVWTDTPRCQEDEPWPGSLSR